MYTHTLLLPMTPQVLEQTLRTSAPHNHTVTLIVKQTNPKSIANLSEPGPLVGLALFSPPGYIEGGGGGGGLDTLPEVQGISKKCLEFVRMTKERLGADLLPPHNPVIQCTEFLSNATTIGMHLDANFKVTRVLIGGVCVCVAVCCGVLRCVAVCCSVVQCGAVCCSLVQCGAVRGSLRDLDANFKVMRMLIGGVCVCVVSVYDNAWQHAALCCCVRV